MIKLSIIIPVYNAEKYLPKCIDSIKEQSLKEIEIICINDGSSDNSLNILNKYRANDLNFYVYSQENLGPAKARNFGIAVAKGEYIAFVDSDDYVDINMYENMYTIAKKNNLLVVMCNYLNEYNNQKKDEAVFILPKDKIINKQEIEKYIYPNLMVDGVYNGPCNKIYSRELINSLDAKMPEGLHYGEDLIFQIAIFDKLEKTYFVNKPFYHYVHRDNSLTTSKKEMFWNTLLPMYKIRVEYAKKWNIPDDVVAEYFVYYSIMDMINTMSGKVFIDKVQLMKSILVNKELSQALKCCKLLKKNYTVKIKMFYLICRIFRKRY